MQLADNSAGPRLKAVAAQVGLVPDSASDGLAKIQATVRARVAREKFLASRQATIRIQAGVRGKQSRNKIMQIFSGEKSRRNLSRHNTLASNSVFTSGVNFQQVMKDGKAGKVAKDRLTAARHQAPNTQRLHGTNGRDGRANVYRGQTTSYAGTNAKDKVRKSLLRDARRLSPIEMVMRIDKFGQTALWPLATSPALWLVVGCFSATAVGARLGHLNFPDLVGGTFESGSLITFMIVFYVGYCYNRYSSMFADLEIVMHSIIQCCFVARVAFKDQAALYDLWRFLNLLHVTAYCGVTATYSRRNLFDEFCAQHGLLSDPTVRARLDAIDVESPLAWNTCLVWALEVVQTRGEEGDFQAPIHKEMVEQILGAGAALSRIYAQEYQVLPYIYTHLVSTACTIYLILHAIVKGLAFDAGATLVEGLLLPAVETALLSLTVLGLLLIGNLLANPLGQNKESFAVCHFVNYACTSSLEAVTVDMAPTLARALQRSGRSSRWAVKASSDGSVPPRKSEDVSASLFGNDDDDSFNGSSFIEASARGMRLAGAAASTANSVLGAVASGVAKRSVRIIDVAGGRSSSSDGRSTSNGTSSTSPPGPIRKSRSSSRSPTFASPGSPEREKGPHGEHEGDESGQSAAPPRRVRIAPE